MNSSNSESQTETQTDSSNEVYSSSAEESNANSSSTKPEYDNLVIDPETNSPIYSQMEVKGTIELTFKELGIALYDYRVTSGLEIANLTLNSAQAKHDLNLYNSGIMTVTGTDWFGNEASFMLTVNEDFSYQITIQKPVNDFFEVNQFRYDENHNVLSDHEMIQAAIDAAHTKYEQSGAAQTVYVYPGEYAIEYLLIKDGVILDMYTSMKNATDGFTEQLAQDVDHTHCAVLTGGAIMNAPFKGNGYEGSSNFTIRGGMLDMQAEKYASGSYTPSSMILSCADNAIIENIIFKDAFNNHAVQMIACTNTVMRNCMFAGFRLGDTFTREVLQIEHAHAGALGYLTFNDNDPRFLENITITNCYFGKSDKYGAPWMGLGHHSGSYVQKHANVTNFYITNNVFDDCIYAAVRYNSADGVQIKGNTFITTSANNYGVYAGSITKNLPVKPELAAMLVFYHRNSYDTGMQNVSIENNTFQMSAGVDRRLVSFNSAASYNETITLKHNVIRFSGAPTYNNDYFAYLTNVATVIYEENAVIKPLSVNFIADVCTQQ